MISRLNLKIVYLAACLITALAAASFSSASTADASRHVPTIDELLTLKTAGGAQISPDGKWVAYMVTAGDFKQDAFVTQIWLAEVATGRNIQLTRGEKSSNNPKWSPDGAWLAFTSNRLEDKNQIFAINPSGGEAVQLTKSETAISNFAWSEDSRNIAYTATEPVPASFERSQRLSGRLRSRAQGLQLRASLDHRGQRSPQCTGGREAAHEEERLQRRCFLLVARRHRRSLFSATLNPDLIQGVTSDVYLLNLADDVVTKLVALPGPDSGPRWSPDGKQIVFASAMGDNGLLCQQLASGHRARGRRDATIDHRQLR